MNRNGNIPGPSLALLTDLYQLTMAYGYWKTGNLEKEGIFNLFFRKNPFSGGLTVACGLQQVIDLLENFSFDVSDIDYLASLTGNDGKALFERGFLDYLADIRFSCDVDAVSEGSVVFPSEPLLRIKGPIIQCQILETPLLNILNFQSLIATKSARICAAAQGDPVMEFGLRRAQGINGALAASRAAYIGGCGSTSNVLAGKIYGIPVKGTHAHSWVMSFADEEEAFREYSRAMPNNCLFLVDTYDTLTGVHNAVKIGHELRKKGHEFNGIRLDSGDLAYLSIEARKILDAGGFNNAIICASNDLDEHIISSLKQQGARINLWGVGTRLATGHDQGALGGVYKLVALRDPEQPWQHRIKLSEQKIKITTPGDLQVRRFIKNGEALGDMIYDQLSGLPERRVIIDPDDHTRRKKFADDAEVREMLEPVARRGRIVAPRCDIHELRQRVKKELGYFHEGIRRFVNPHLYPVGLEEKLHQLKARMITENRKVSE
ncbi:MAG TPA: nicotinate phosphoribosyltransferase [Candidatus Rifleibacterium sp.]|nr:nicotinate phosphoribosyltransferase [Candidatus Rifleibacterium sp.]HPT44857.1 nicotinate phosphoribosyltransferase [Candidatus Rifleibacterium sp.]